MSLDRVLKPEMARQAKRALKADMAEVTKKLNAQRKEIVALKRQLAALTKAVKTIGRSAPKPAARVQAVEGDQKLRFRAAGFASLRKKLGVTQSEMARLVGVSSITVLKWEKGAARPRAAQLAAIAAVRKMGKRQVRAQLDDQG